MRSKKDGADFNDSVNMSGSENAEEMSIKDEMKRGFKKNWPIILLVIVILCGFGTFMGMKNISLEESDVSDSSGMTTAAETTTEDSFEEEEIYTTEEKTTEAEEPTRFDIVEDGQFTLTAKQFRKAFEEGFSKIPSNRGDYSLVEDGDVVRVYEGGYDTKIELSAAIRNEDAEAVNVSGDEIPFGLIALAPDGVDLDLFLDACTAIVLVTQRRCDYEEALRSLVPVFQNGTHSMKKGAVGYIFSESPDKYIFTAIVP